MFDMSLTFDDYEIVERIVDRGIDSRLDSMKLPKHLTLWQRQPIDHVN